MDRRLVELGLAESREKAQRLILAGGVRIAGRTETKPSLLVDPLLEVALVEKERFVGRGGLKLERAFERFGLDVNGLTCADIGASTGGFTDCLLQHGAERVYAIDVGRGQLHWSLRNNSRVIVMEGVNARHLSELPERPAFASMDVSFISLTKVLPAVNRILVPASTIVSLIKPQFEAGKEQVGRGGVVHDPAVHAEVIDRVRSFGTEELGLLWVDVCESPIKGPAGNIEFLACWKKGES